MRALFLLVLLSLTAHGQGRFERFCARAAEGRSDRGLQCGGAAFEFAPLSGAGMPSACSSTAPTGAQGQTVTTVRATNATCQATAAGGMVTSGIANGELSVLGNNVPRVEYDRNGVKGFRVEGTRIVLIIQNEDFTNAAWSLASGGAPNPGNPVRTSNAAVAPDGNTTADKLDFAATSGTGFGVIYNTAGRASTAATYGHALYVRGVSGSGTIYDMSTPGGAYNSTACAFVSTSWSRCAFASLETVATWYNQVGFDLRDAAQSGQGAQSVYLWRPTAELGAFASSSMSTAGASVQRNADVISLPVTLSGTTFSAAISYDTPSTLATGMTAFQVYVDANNSVTAALDAANKLVCTFRIGGVDSTVTTAGALTAGAVNRVACQYGAAGRKACLGGTCATTAGALVMPTGAATFYVGTRSATGNEAFGVLSQGCYDPADPRCI